jgi:hypothetical protein
MFVSAFKTFAVVASTAALTITAGFMNAPQAKAYGSSYCTNIGSTSFCNGYGNGGSWNGTSTRIGGTDFYNGYDSNGNSIMGSCTTIGSSRFCNNY